MLLTRPTLRLVLIATALLFDGCSGQVNHQISDYVGEYVFTPGEKTVPPKFANVVFLREDGVALELRYEPSSKSFVPHNTSWRFEDDPHDPVVVIGDFAHGIYRERGSLRLGIDQDNGLYYQKVR